MIRVYGKPRQLDFILRPFMRVTMHGTGALASFVLVWWQAWMWAPLPLALSFVTYELYFWFRRDKALELRLDGHTATLIDPIREDERAVDVSTMRTAWLAYKKSDGPWWEAWVTLGDAEGPQLAVRLHTRQPGEWARGHVDLDAFAMVLGGNPGAVRAMAPTHALARQVVDDPDGKALRWFLSQVPPDAWGRVGARVWQGRTPPLDLIGLHEGLHHGVITLEGHSGSLVLHGETRSFAIDQLTGGRSLRAITMLRLAGKPEDGVRGLPLMHIGLAEGVQLCVPAVLAGKLGAKVEREDDALHTHLAEGAPLLWHLLHHLPDGALHSGLLEALYDARNLGAKLPHDFLRHVEGWAPEE